MKLSLTTRGWADCLHWTETDRKTIRRINRLIGEALRDLVNGIGKPEPLRQQLAGYWSRRIDDEHRLVHKPKDDELITVQARYRYE
ncbi:Txe/YoeB family addiction module toxin [Streptomyces sp. 8K308]|uniref:Txe/YoeB family addiction module toxin n=1 Tax=Streptomyces sp. 8K308 TaxID=2530388 RepID=UPI00104888D7|nr:Txe/YoeB family addiction module toxin [Streptomyces sp. 8K308]TDC23712.1 Txe/YoeB family addiction module toxin [Streptomyces sp. 8K308]